MLIGFFYSSEVLAKTFLISGYGKRVSMLGMYPIMITDAIPV